MYFIMYATGAVEIVKETNETLIRLIDTGVISFILDMDKKEIKSKTDKGVQDMPVPII